MEGKKISFGFTKISKKPNLFTSKENSKPDKKELIKCLEGQEIKLVQEREEKKPLVIPLKESHSTSTALASLMKRRAVLLGEDEQEDKKENSTSVSFNIEESADIEKRAALELLAEIQNNGTSYSANKLILPVKADDLPLEGAQESTMDDYDNIPIQDFGKAILRGMGWTEPLPKNNNMRGLPIDDTPIVRPKGMGLGADKALNKKTLLVAPEANEVLEIKRNSYVRILGGKFKELYGQIEGFDDHAGRVIVKLAIGGTKESFNEFLCQPVSRKEYAKYGKCINSIKYEEFKKNENEFGQINLDKINNDIERNAKDIKKQQHESVDEKYSKNYDYTRNHKYKDYKDVKNYTKKESDSKSEKEGNLVGSYDKYHNREEHRDHREITSRSEYNIDTRDIYDEKNAKIKTHKNDESYCQRDGDRQSVRSRLLYKKDDPSDSEKEFSKYKKYKKSHMKKKMKKNKSKYKRHSSDTETISSSMNSLSDSEEEKIKKHRKKTKKSKKHRERSRSRGKR